MLCFRALLVRGTSKMALARAALLAALPAATLSASPECQLNGVSVPGQGCVCEPAWHGPNCEYMTLLPADPASGLHMAGNSSWGGTVLFDAASQRWHMYVSIFEDHCGLAEWQPNSAIGRLAGA